jgi:mxaJ protein
MSLRFRSFWLIVVVCISSCSKHEAPKALASAGTLRVCADPNNMPYSNRKEEGFENKIAGVVAKAMHRNVEYYWWAQRRGYIRNTLDSCRCDVLIGVPRAAERTLNTQSYYRSSYCFVYRKESGIHVRSLDDPELRTLRVGVQIVAGDYSNTPPVLALNRRHIVTNVRGYTVFGDYTKPDPPMEVLRALERGDIDVAIAWGPHAGFFAKYSRVPLTVVQVSPHIDLPYLPFIYDVSMGVRRKNDTLRNELETAIARTRPTIDSILRAYNVPLVADGPITNEITPEEREAGDD